MRTRSRIFRSFTASVSAFVIVALSGSLLQVSAAVVQLDTAFNGTGYVTHHNAGGSAGSDYGYDSLVQSDGKIVVVGESRGNNLAFDMAIWRYNPDGTLDTTFNGVGYLTHRITAGGSGYARGNAVVQQTDGKYLVAGYSRNGGANQTTLWRVNTDGTLDTTFNVTGYVLSSTPAPNGGANDVKLQSDGKIVVAGSNSSDMVIWRYNANGSVDTTFNGTGFVSYAGPGSSIDNAYALQVQADGKITTAGITNGDMAIWRYDSGGALDTTFNGAGLFTHHNAAGGNATDWGKGLDIQSDGKYIVAGHSWGSASTYNNIAVWRVNTNGTLDTTFNSVGYNTYSGGNAVTDIAHAVKIDASGKVLVAGSTGSSSFDMILLRYRSDGTLDTDFAGSGFVTHHNTAGGNNTDEAYDVELQADGKIVLAGDSVAPTGQGYDMALWRYEVLNQLRGVSGQFDVRTQGYDPISLITYGSVASNVSVEVYLPGNVNIAGGDKSAAGTVGADKVIAELSLDMSADRNWQGFTAFSDTYQKRSYLNYTPNLKLIRSTLKVTNIPGVISPRYTLFVPKTNASNQVYVCPFATMDSGCQGGVTINANSTVIYNGDVITVTPVVKNWNQYWQVSGLSQFVAVTSN